VPTLAPLVLMIYWLVRTRIGAVACGPGPRS
jgi:hypothetical protein